ncbi:MAG: MFS transporter [Bifidobacteriaceae bacterium]|jgi:MFS family permease|nr:MFS transporter [Bifidobacteriaceae bacterium]
MSEHTADESSADPGQGAPDPAGQSGADSADSRIVGGWKFLPAYFLANAAMFAVFQGMQQILLPSQIASIDPEGKVLGFGLLSSIGALAAAVGNPLFGSLSDRTRSRFGRRTPWLIASSALALLLLLVLARMTAMFWLAASYILVMLVMSAYQAVIMAVMPDRVPERRRGLASAVLGIASSLGTILAINLTAGFVERPWVGYLVVGALLVVAAWVLSVFAPDPTRHSPPAASAPAAKSFRERMEFFSALADHDYAWMFWTRALLMVGSWTVMTFQMYILQDYIGEQNLPGGGLARAVALLGTAQLIAMLASMAVVGPLSDKFRRRKPFVLIAAAGYGLAALIPVFAPTWTGMVTYVAVGGVFFGSFNAVDGALGTLVLPDKEHQARDLGLLTVASTGPQIAGPFVAAAIITLTGTYAAIFVVGAVCAVLAGIGVMKIRKVK